MIRRVCQWLLPPWPGEDSKERCSETGEKVIVSTGGGDLLVWLCREHANEIKEAE